MIRSRVATPNVMVLPVRFVRGIDFSVIRIRAPRIAVVRLEMIRKFRICFWFEDL